MNSEAALPSDATKAPRRRKEITDISSMLLPVGGRFLLLPGVAVAEIVTFVTPEPSYEEDVPAWYLGIIHWRNQRVPLVSFEAMTGQAVPQLSNHCRIAVLNNTGLNHELNFFAILLQATPKLLRLSPDELTGDNEKILEDGEKMHVIVLGEEAIIPDTQFIERALIQYLQLS